MNEYKIRLLKEIVKFLKLDLGSCIYLKVNGNDRSFTGFYLDFESNQFRSLASEDIRFNRNDDDIVYDLSRLSNKPRQNIVQLIQMIFDINNGFNLWHSIQNQLAGMPKWWHFFSRQRALTSALKGIQKQCPFLVLKAEDDKRSQGKYEVLKSKNLALQEKVRKLMTQCDTYNNEIDELQSQLDQRIISRRHYEDHFEEKNQRLQEEKDLLIREIEDLQKLLQNLHNENIRVKGELKQLRQQHKDLTEQSGLEQGPHDRETKLLQKVKETKPDDKTVKEKSNKQKQGNLLTRMFRSTQAKSRETGSDTSSSSAADFLGQI